MRNIFIMIALLIANLIYSQKTQLRLHYETKFNSPFILELLRKSSKNHEEYNQVIKEVEKVKVNYSLYILDNGASYYKIDAEEINKKVSLLGYPIFNLYKEGVLLGEEYLMKDKVNYKLDNINFEWSISDSTTEILGYNCYEASSSYFPGVKVWFTTELMIKRGPAYIQGIPGLVVKYQTDFDETNILDINTSISEEETNQIIDEYTVLEKKITKPISLDKLIDSKIKFKNQISKKQG